MKTRNILTLVLVVLTIITLGSVSGTYAKYTFAESVADSARVAKWRISNNDEDKSIFYLGEDADVKSLNDSNVIAPGTEGEYSFQLTGEVETDYTLDFKFTEVSDTINKAVNKADGTPYSPIVYTFYNENTKVCDSTDINTFATCVTEQVSGLTNGEPTVHKAGEVKTPVYTFKWAWAFDNQEDAADTELANMMYDELENNPTSEKYGIKFGVTVSATQYNAE